MANFPPVIGIVGRKFGGKNTFAKMLYEQVLTRSFATLMPYEMAFADPLKDGLRAFFGLNTDQLHGNLKEVVDVRYGVTPRELLQRFGSLGRAINPDIWVIRLRETLQERAKYSSLPSVSIVTDVRFPNEAETVRELGGVLVRVNRSSAGSGVHELHESEQWAETLMVSHEIDNNSTLDALDKQAIDLFNHYYSMEKAHD